MLVTLPRCCPYSDTPITRAVILYLLRPNVPSKLLIEKRLESILPKSLDSRFAIGMPLRGSDKCGKESNCLGFDEYMEVAKDAWEALRTESKASSTTLPEKGSLILTTEDRKLFQQRLSYSMVNFPYQFVVNEQDVLQSSGSYWEISKSTREAPDQVVLSSLIAMKMQLHAKFVYGNCCSNFHRLIFDMIRLGCGFHEPESIWRCYPNICCSWTSKADCEKIRADYNQTISKRKERQLASQGSRAA